MSQKQLTPEEAKRQAGKENKKAGISASFRLIKLYFPLFVTFFAAILIIAGIILACSVFLGGREFSKSVKAVTYALGEDTQNVKTKSITYNGTLCVNFSEIARFCGMSVSGDRENLKFVSDSGENASFTADSRFCTVNGTEVEMESEAVMKSGELWLPLSFVQSCVEGITVTVTEDGTYIGITQDTVGTGDETSPVSVTFLYKGNSPLGKIGEDSNSYGVSTLPGGSLAYTFANDLSAYYKYLNPSDTDTYLKLINSTYRDDGSFEPENLVSVINKKPGLSNITMEQCAEKALEAMFIELYSAGYRDIYVNMAYRDYKTQKKQFDIFVYNEQYWPKTHSGVFSDAAKTVLGESYLYSTYISKASDKLKMTLSKSDAERVAMSYSAYPGTGDHQTGLAVDLVSTSANVSSFDETEAYEWLQKYAYQFGFIERYPKGKEKITGFSSEPRHWRFVGQTAAAEIHSKGITLEEYIADLQN